MCHMSQEWNVFQFLWFMDSGLSQYLFELILKQINEQVQLTAF